MKMNTRKNNGFFRSITLLILIVYSASIVAFAPPKAFAQSTTTRKTRLTIPVNKLAVLVSEKNNGVSSNKVLVADYLSSTKAVINEEGVTTGMPSYYPYGSIRDDVQNETDRLYTQQRKVTADSSVYNYNARYYNPSVGLFIQPDSVKGPHRYSYADDDPIMLNDPSGNCPMCIGALLGGGLDLGVQLLVEGKTMEEVNWGSVAISAAGGAVGAGLGANIAKMAATTSAKAIMMVGADAGVGLGTSIIEGSVAGSGQNFGEALVASMYGATFGAAGGKVASNAARRLSFGAKAGGFWGNNAIDALVPSRAFTELAAQTKRNLGVTDIFSVSYPERVRAAAKVIYDEIPYDTKNMGAMADIATSNTVILQRARVDGAVCRHMAGLCRGTLWQLGVDTREIVFHVKNGEGAHTSLILSPRSPQRFGLGSSADDYIVVDPTWGGAVQDLRTYATENGISNLRYRSNSGNGLLKPLPNVPY